MNTQREQLIHTWLTSVLENDQFQIAYLAGDASFRRYARIQLQNKTYMLMDAPPEKEDCVPFVTIDEFFAGHGVRVPQIVAKDLNQGFLLLEDFGDVLLSTLLNDETVDQYYEQSFKQLIHLQSINGAEHFPAYSYEKLLSEMQLLTDWMLPSLDIHPTAEQKKTIDDAFDFLAQAALAQPQVIVHRDFQFIVINGDVLTNMNFEKLLDFHEKREAIATMCVREFQYQIPYGVVNSEDNVIQSMTEKPSYFFDINTGIYVISPELLAQVNAQFIGMPTILEQQMEKKNKVLSYPLHEYWLDIGHMEDYNRAQKDIHMLGLE